MSARSLRLSTPDGRSRVDPCFDISANAATKSRRGAAWRPVSPSPAANPARTNNGQAHGPKKVRQKLYCWVGTGRATVRVSGNPASAQPVMSEERLRRGCGKQSVQLHRFPFYGLSRPLMDTLAHVSCGYVVEQSSEEASPLSEISSRYARYGGRRTIRLTGAARRIRTLRA